MKNGLSYNDVWTGLMNGIEGMNIVYALGAEPSRINNHS